MGQTNSRQGVLSNEHAISQKEGEVRLDIKIKVHQHKKGLIPEQINQPEQQMDKREQQIEQRKRNLDMVKSKYEKWLLTIQNSGGTTAVRRLRSLSGWTHADRAYDRRLCQRILSWNGMLTEDDLPGNAMIPEYWVVVCEHECIAIYHRLAVSSSGALGLPRKLTLPVEGVESDRLMRRLTRMAIRAVYALGLDYGLVRIALAQRGRMAIRGIEPFPDQPSGITSIFAAVLSVPGYADEEWLARAKMRHDPSTGSSATISGVVETATDRSDSDGTVSGKFSSNSVKSLSARKQIIHPVAVHRQDSNQSFYADRVMVGLDVEFVLTDVRGELVLADRYLPRSGTAGHDVALVHGRMMHALAELRPEPSNDPRQLVVHLKQAMGLAAARISDPTLAWRAGASPVAGISIGGHIHLSGVPLSFELLRTLDNYLALPLSLLEDNRALSRRPLFGWLGHARKKRHGGFEYRTPASWIISPTVTSGVLALAKLIAVHYKSLRHRPLASLKMQKAYYEGDKDQLGSFLPLWREDIEKTPLFDEYKEQLLEFIRLLDEGWCWEEGADIRAAWGLLPVMFR